MTVLRIVFHGLVLLLLAAFCWGSGDLAPLFGYALGMLAMSVEAEIRMRREGR